MTLHTGELILIDFWNAVERGKQDELPPQVLHAWVDGEALAVVYTSHTQDKLILGFRRAWPPHYRDDDPATTGSGIYTEISEPLGKATVVQDQNGILWSGDLQATPPPLPQKLDGLPRE